MSDLKITKAHMIMEFHHFLKATVEVRNQHDNKLDLNQQLGEFEDSIDAEEFVDRSLSAMKELAKADPAIKDFMSQYEDSKQRKALIESVEKKVYDDTTARITLEETENEAVGDYWRAREKFTKVGGKCLDNMVSRNILQDFASNVGAKAREAFSNVYEQMLSKNGPFESKIKELGLQDSATVARYQNLFPQVAMTPEAERDVVKVFSELLEKGMEKDFHDVATPDDYQALVAGNVRATNVAMEFHRVLPLADLYLDLRNMKPEEALERIEDYRQSRQHQKDSELSR